MEAVEIKSEAGPSGKYVLVQKLSEVMKELGAIGKDGRNNFQNYEYVSHANMMSKLHPLLCKQGIIMRASHVTVEHYGTSENAKGNTQSHVVLKVRYELTDGNETIYAVGIGEGVDSGDKASYKAQTGAHKYALKALFSIPDELDAEGDETTDAPARDIPRKFSMSKKDLAEAIKQHIMDGDVPRDVLDSWKSDYGFTSTAGLKEADKKTLDTMYNDIVSVINDGS